MDEPKTRKYGLTPAERTAYEEDGFFVRESVFSDGELEGMRCAGEEVVSRAEQSSRDGRDYRIDGNRYVDAPGATSRQAGITVQYEHDEAAASIRVIEPFHHLHDVFDRLIDDPRVVDPMCGVIGTEGVAVWTDKINLKRPRQGSAFRWHQDSPYWTHACDHVDQLPNVLITLDDADEENGCFRVIRGSHRKGCLPGIHDGTTLGVLFTDPAYFDESAQVAAVVPAGSLIFFSPHTVHGSQSNESERPRRAMVLTYQPPGHRMFKVDATRNAG